MKDLTDIPAVMAEIGANAKAAAAEFRKITDKPIKTIIYTHFHADHVSGAKAFVTEEALASGEVVGTRVGE